MSASLRAKSLAKRLGRAALGVAIIAWIGGLILFVRKDGSITVTLPRQREPPSTEHNLASRYFGPTIRASSYFDDVYTQHHPVFLVDGRGSPSTLEKWASAPYDRHPWVEIRWREPRSVRRVVVHHGGTVEGSETTAKSYRIMCLMEGGTLGPPLNVFGNGRSVAEHRLSCERALGIRLQVEPNAPGDVVRVYEVEAWGT